MNESDVFDEYATEYDSWFDKHKAEFALELNAIRELLPETGTGIEIGAGTGRFAQALGISLGIEPSAKMRQIAEQRGVHVIGGLAESLPVNNNGYDYALLVTTVCFLDSLEVAFREVHRVLKDSGYILIAFIDKTSTVGKKYAKNKNKFYQDATFYSATEIQKKLEKTGYKHFEFVQAFLPDDTEQRWVDEVKSGHGEGSFVVLRAQKFIGE